MKLYLVARTDDIGYDEYDAFVVRAASPEDAAAVVADSHNYTWPVKNGGENIEVTELSADGEETIILSSFNAG